MKNSRTVSSSPYDFFARIYDRVTAHVPMNLWAEYLVASAGRFGVEFAGSTVADLACGTGTLLHCLMSGPLAKYRLSALGVDLSPPMLERAKARVDGHAKYRVTQGDLCKTGLEDSSIDWAICTHDSINYLTEDPGLRAHFKEVRRILKRGALYSFDAVTEDNMIREFDGHVREEFIDGLFLHWSNSYDRGAQILTSDLVFQDGSSMIKEVHYQRYYDEKKILGLAQDSGFECLAVEGEYKPRAIRARDAFMNFHLRAI